MLLLHKPKCKNIDKTFLRSSNESHIQWKKQFHKNLLHFSIYAHFEADKEIDNFSVGHKTINIFGQKTQNLMVII